MVVGDTVNMAASLFGSPSNFHMFYAKEGATGWNSEPVIFSPDTLSDLIEDHDRWTADIVIDSAGHYYWYLFATSQGVSERYPVYDFMSFEVIDQVAAQPVVINELLAINETTNMDEAGEYDDWIELWNYSDVHVDLSGHYLTDINDNLEKWQFPDTGVVIGPGEFLIIWCDEDQEQGSLHTNFKLSSSGEFLALVAPDGSTIIDSVSFPDQETDISYGRTDDGSEAWTYFVAPTPGSSNQVLSALNEGSLPRLVKIHSIYPNPFNMSSTILFQVQEPGETILEIYNITGQLVRQEALMVDISGTHRWVWDGTDQNGVFVGSGIAMVRISRRNESTTGKMILVK